MNLTPTDGQRIYPKHYPPDPYSPLFTSMLLTTGFEFSQKHPKSVKKKKEEKKKKRKEKWIAWLNRVSAFELPKHNPTDS